jgi:hypothetical protein
MQIFLPSLSQRGSAVSVIMWNGQVTACTLVNLFAAPSNIFLLHWECKVGYICPGAIMWNEEVTTCTDLNMFVAPSYILLLYERVN